MKVKIRDIIYDSEKDIIEVRLNEREHRSISSMLPETTKYCVPPYFMRKEEVIRFIRDAEEEEEDAK